MKAFHRFFFLGCMFLFVLGGCSFFGKENIPTAASTPTLEKLEKDVAEARSDRVNVFAPQSFARAEEFLSTARLALEQNEPVETIKALTDDVRSNLETARHTAGIVGPLIQEVNAARNQAHEARAEILGKAFGSAEKQYVKLIKAINHQGLDYIRKHGPLVRQAYLDLEITILQNKALGPARALMDKARNQDAHKLAPETYEIAENALKSAEQGISLAPHENQVIQKHAEKAEFQVRRLLAVTESVRDFSERTPEQSALRLESILSQMDKSLGNTDNRDQPVREQISRLVRSAEAMARTNRTLTSEKDTCLAKVDRLEKQLKATVASQDALINQRIVQRENRSMIQKMQRVFSPGEAEISKRGDRILIRLRDLSFPEGEATLSPNDFGLLDKVQDVIMGFSHPQVTIEGYVGNTGSSEMNELISQMRAVAVKAYLLGKQTLPPERIQAVGNIGTRDINGVNRSDDQGIDVVIRPLASGEKQ